MKLLDCTLATDEEHESRKTMKGLPRVAYNYVQTRTMKCKYVFGSKAIFIFPIGLLE